MIHVKICININTFVSLLYAYKFHIEFEQIQESRWNTTSFDNEGLRYIFNFKSHFDIPFIANRMARRINIGVAHDQL